MILGVFFLLLRHVGNCGHFPGENNCIFEQQVVSGALFYAGSLRLHFFYHTEFILFLELGLNQFKSAIMNCAASFSQKHG